MPYKIILPSILMLLACLTLWTCKKYIIVCPQNETFCTLIDEQDYEATLPFIDNFLASMIYANYASALKKDNQDRGLLKLKNWLECKSCVDRARILCNSCIETGIAQSELKIDFISNGQIVTLILDIYMENPLRTRKYHR